MTELLDQEPKPRHTSPARSILAWSLAAVAAVALLVGVLRWESSEASGGWGTVAVGDAKTGARIFREKGCAYCHAVNRIGGGIAPDLGTERPSTGPDQLVTAMWNHAPKMWDRIREERVAYPALTQQQMAHLFAFLYTSRYLGDPGDREHGRRVFEQKNCGSCHTFGDSGGKRGPNLSERPAARSLVGWTQAMWNHAPAMEKAMAQAGVVWPRFEDKEMTDLLAYIRGAGEVANGSDLLPADPERGRQLFAEKSCGVCHSLRGGAGRIGPELGSRQQLPATIVQFAGAMWNHSPQMWRVMQERGVKRPSFEGREMADLVAFLYSLHYSEPGGSAQVGEMLFESRGCSQCHGPSGRGLNQGPPLRGRGKAFNSIGLAAALWAHGPAMYKRARNLGIAWPQLAESDVGDLMAFLNTAPGD
jgi:mono/diheme cytochrome c family protein